MVVTINHRREKINDFFETDFAWWENVYDSGFHRGFFAFEMTRRRDLVLEMLNDTTKGTSLVTILDCGCGPGGILREINPGGRLLAGVDINLGYLRKAHSICDPTDEFLQADVEQLPFKDNSFDIAYCVGVLSFLERDRYAIEEMSRVLKPGGRLIISLPNFFMLNKLFDPYYYVVWPIRTIIKKIRTIFQPSSVRDPKYDIEMSRRYRHGQLDRLFRELGLQKRQTFDVSFGPVTLWRKEVLPSHLARRISEMLVRLRARRGFGFLTLFTNHWVISWQKTT